MFGGHSHNVLQSPYDHSLLKLIKVNFKSYYCHDNLAENDYNSNIRICLCYGALKFSPNFKMIWPFQKFGVHSQNFLLFSYDHSSLQLVKANFKSYDCQVNLAKNDCKIIIRNCLCYGALKFNPNF